MIIPRNALTELAVVAMRLTSVTADNVLSMEHATVEPGDGLTVIVGPNGAGKTNMVRVVICQGEKSCG